MEKELRYIDASFEVRADEEKPKVISGYALTFNAESKDFGGWREIIRPEALTGVLEKSDVYMTLNHNIDRGILARFRNSEKDSLKLTIDEVGLRFEFEPPQCDLGNEVYEGIRRGDISQCSFAFCCTPDGYHWEDRASSDGLDLRVITQFDVIGDCSVVYNPAYDSTSCECRAYDEYKAQKEEEKRKQDEEKRAQLEQYYKELEEKIVK